MKRIYRFLGLAVMASPFAFAELVQAEAKPQAAIAQSPTAAPYRIKTEPCPELLLSEETEGKTVTCGILTVPENYNQPNGRQVEISYARIHSKSLSPLPDPIFYLEGGPGGSSIEQLIGFPRAFATHRQTRDLVVFDQRGAKYSAPRLGCEPVSLATKELAQFDQYVKKVADGNPLTDDKKIALYAFCAELLQRYGGGIDLSQFNTPNSARDTVNLAAALGYKQVNLYGVSYGTNLAMVIMRDHPKWVRSVLLDSTATPHVNKYTEGTRRMVTPVANLLQDCQTDAACNQAYPNLKDRLNALLEKLDKNPIPLPKANTSATKAEPAEVAETSITLESFASHVPEWLNNNSSFATYLPLMINQLEQGNTTLYEQALSGKLFQAAPQPEGFQVAQYYQKLATKFQIEAEKLLQTRAFDAQLKRPSLQWVKQVLGLVKELPEDKKNRATINFFGLEYESGKTRNRGPLIALVTKTFPTQTAKTLQARLEAMSEAEVRHIYEVLANALEREGSVDKGTTKGMYMSVDCREQASWGSPAALEADYRRQPLPLLGKPEYIGMLEQFAMCKHWPVKPANSSEHQVVKSNIPTLVMQGRYDSHTTTDRGVRAMEGLTNGTYVEFPRQGHGVTIQHLNDATLPPCARDIGIAFIDRPEVAPDTSCTTALKPKFVLPSK